MSEARVPRALLVLVTLVAWTALLRLGWAFVTDQLAWRYVAEQSRTDAPWYDRLAGVWGGMEGSLLASPSSRRSGGRCSPSRWRPPPVPPRPSPPPRSGTLRPQRRRTPGTWSSPSPSAG